MASPSTIKEFLVSLGWKLDQTSQRKFATSIAAQTVALQELARGTEAAAAKLLKFFEGVAEGAEKLYFVSMRTKASVANIQALGFAAGQMGSSVDAATSSLESMARFLRENPGGESWIQNLGVQTRQANGELRDTTDVMQDLGKQLAHMPYYLAKQYGSVLGIDEKTLMALREGMGQFGDEYKDILKVTGVDSQTAARSSHEFMNQLRGVRATFEAVSMVAAAKALPALTQYSKKLRERLIQNLPWITEVLSKVIKGITFITGTVSQLGGRVFDAVRGIIDWWGKLDDASKQVIEALGGIIVAWRLLNVAFITSPIGIITALATGIALLYDDYKTWKEGGKSLIDWSQWKTEIDLAKEGITGLIDRLKELKAWADVHLDIAKPGYAKNVVHSASGTIGAIREHDYKGAWDAFRGYGPRAHPEAKDTAANTANLFAALEKQFNLPAGFMDAVYAKESGRGNRLDNTKSGAQGPFQFLPSTSKEYGLKNPYDLRESAPAAAKKLRHLIDFFHGDLAKALAGYNWGEGHVMRDGMQKAPKETKDYVATILGNIGRTAENPYKAEFKAGTPNAAAGGSTAPAISQTTNITVNGATDPKKTAKEIGNAQDRVNQNLIRNTAVLAY